MKQKENDQPIQLPSIRSMAMPTGSNQQFQQNPKSSTIPNPLQNPHINSEQLQQQQYMSSGGDTTFSFHKMRQSLGQKGESLRKKILTTTVEWKEAASRRDSDLPSFDPLGGMAINQNANTSLLPTYPAAGVATGVVAQSGTVSTPKQHQHEMWSQLLQQKIWTVQEFLLDLESKENKGSVPRGVWEALADMDRMQRELLNYSRSY
jgi:hypothetical protein